MSVTVSSPGEFLDRAAAVQAPVRLARASVFMLSVPQVRVFRSAYGRSAANKRIIVVRLEDADGVTGWGEAPVSERPLYGTDTAESTWWALTGLLLPPLLRDASFAGPADVAATWAGFLGQHYAKNAVETAVWAIASTRLGVPLARLWGGTADAVPVGESFPICDTIEALPTRWPPGWPRASAGSSSRSRRAGTWPRPGPCARPSPACRCRSTPTAATPPPTRPSPGWTSSACS